MRLMEEDSDDQGDDDGGAGSGRPEDLSRLLRLEIADDNAPVRPMGGQRVDKDGIVGGGD